MERRVVLTGIGIVSPCGVGINSLLDSVVEKKSAITNRQEDDPLSLPIIDRAGFIRDFQPSKFIKNRKSLKVMCRDIQMAVVASFLAKEDAGLTEEIMDPKRAGACIGAGIFEHDPEEMSDSFLAALGNGGNFDTKQFGAEGMGQLFPLWLLKYLPNMPACHITISHNLQGPSNTLTADSAGSACAIEESIRIIQRGRADVMFCGGAESRLYGVGLLRYHSGGILSGGGSELSYPVFSEESEGIVFGEGGAILILEELEHALKRGANIYAEVKSFKTISEGQKDPEENGVIRKEASAMSGCVQGADVNLDDVTSIHLSAKGVKSEDIAESKAIQEAFSGCASKPQLVSNKAITGFMGYAAAPTEVALSAASIRNKKPLPSFVSGKPLLNTEYPISPVAEAFEAKQNVLVNHFEPGFSYHSFLLSSVEEK